MSFTYLIGNAFLNNTIMYFWIRKNIIHCVIMFRNYVIQAWNFKQIQNPREDEERKYGILI